MSAQEANLNYFTTELTSRGCTITKYTGPETGAVVIPARVNESPVTRIGESAFEKCSGLTGVTIPDSVTEIAYSAFRHCAGLTGITIPEGVEIIGECAFQFCGGLTAVTIPDTVTQIDDWAFSHCKSLTSVTIPGSVVEIGNGAFEYCDPSLVIHGPARSEAESYAKRRHVGFEAT